MLQIGIDQQGLSFTTSTPVLCPCYGVVCLQSLKISCWQPCASDLIANRDPVVPQVVLASEDLKVFACMSSKNQSCQVSGI